MRPVPDTNCRLEGCGHPKGAHKYDYDRGNHKDCTRPDCSCVRYTGPIAMVSPSHTHAATERVPMMCRRCKHPDNSHIGGRCHEVSCGCTLFVPAGRGGGSARGAVVGYGAGWSASGGSGGAAEWVHSDHEHWGDLDPEKPYGVDLVELSKAIKAVEKGYLTRQAPEIVAAAKAFLDLHEAALAMSKAAEELKGVMTEFIVVEDSDEDVEVAVTKCAHGETTEHRFYDTADDGRIITRKCSGPLGVVKVHDGTGRVVREIPEWSLLDEDEDLEEE